MRFAVISDLHANRQALNAVLTDIRSVGVDQILCLGDIVGYGPAPAEVLAEAYARVHHFVLGNHDAVIGKIITPDAFNEDARRLIDWTAAQLDRKAVQFLGGLPLVLEGQAFRCAHGDFTDPPAFNYVLEPADALACWQTFPEPVMFVGHTHVPALFVIGASGTPHAVPAQDFVLEEGKRFIVNVGSVGQPRDSDVRASWVLYNAARGTVFFRRVPFDLEAYRADLKRAGITARASHFLGVAERQAAPPLRELLDFHPVKREAAERPQYKVQNLEAALRSARRWRRAGIALALLLLAAVAAGIALLEMWRPPGVTYEASAPPAVAEIVPVADTNLLAEPEAIGAVTAANRLRTWSVNLADPEAQKVSVAVADAEGGGAAAFRLESREPLEMALLSAPVFGAKGTRFSASAQFLAGKLEAGWIRLELLEQTADGTRKLLHQKELRRTGSGRWETVRFTLEKDTERLAAPGQVSLAVRGQFRGQVLVRKCSLERRE